MATIKQLLERTMLKIGSRAGGITSSAIVVESVPSLTKSPHIKGYTAPCDGYLSVRAATPSSRATVTALYGLSEDGGNIGQSAFSPGASQAKACIFLKKGSNALYALDFSGTVTGLYVYFLKSVGGGGIAFLRKLLSMGGFYAYA